MRETFKQSLLGLGISLLLLMPFQVGSDNIEPPVQSETIEYSEAQEQFPEQKPILEPEYIVIRQYMAVTSWYQHGRVTANGERYNPMGLTTAHKRLPFNTLVRLTNPANGNTVIVRVNDRGPFIRGREFDVSLGAAITLDMVEVGVTRLHVEIITSNN